MSRFNPRATQVLTRTDGGKLVSGALACDHETASNLHASSAAASWSSWAPTDRQPQRVTQTVAARLGDHATNLAVPPTRRLGTKASLRKQW